MYFIKDKLCEQFNMWSRNIISEWIFYMLDKCNENKQRINLKLKLKWKRLQKHDTQSLSAKNNEEDRRCVVIFFIFVFFLLRNVGHHIRKIINISLYERGMTYYESYSVKT